VPSAECERIPDSATTGQAEIVAMSGAAASRSTEVCSLRCWAGCSGRLTSQQQPVALTPKLQ
jgi:hypothetical protein